MNGDATEMSGILKMKQKKKDPRNVENSNSLKLERGRIHKR